MQIRHSLRLLSSAHFHSEHVKSHQDDLPQKKPLSWHAQINIRCDSIATAYLQEQDGTASSLVPFLPASVVAVTLNATTITGRLPYHLRLYCGSRLPHSNTQRSQIDCICKAQGWSDDQFQQVDWARFNVSTNQTTQQGHQHFCQRWTNNILPVMIRLHKWNLEKSDKCPSHCGMVETDDHLLQCQQPERVEALSDFSKTITDTFNKHHTDPSLRQILKFFLSTTDPTISYNLDDLLPQYRRLHRAQLALGKLSVFRGFFHKDWVILQKAYLQLQQLPHGKHQAESLITTWARAFQSAAHDQWRIRNESLHVDKPSSLAFKHTLLRLRIHELYETKDSIPLYEQEKVFGDISMEQRLDQPANQQKAWIQSARKIVATATKKAAQPPPGNKDIRSFFVAVPPRGQHQGRPPG